MSSSITTLDNAESLAWNYVTFSGVATEHLFNWFKMAAADVEFWASLETNFSLFEVISKAAVCFLKLAKALFTWHKITWSINPVCSGNFPAVIHLCCPVCGLQC